MVEIKPQPKKDERNETERRRAAQAKFHNIEHPPRARHKKYGRNRRTHPSPPRQNYRPTSPSQSLKSTADRANTGKSDHTPNHRPPHPPNLHNKHNSQSRHPRNDQLRRLGRTGAEHAGKALVDKAASRANDTLSAPLSKALVDKAASRANDTLSAYLSTDSDELAFQPEVPDTPERSLPEDAEHASLYKGSKDLQDYEKLRETKEGRKEIRSRFTRRKRAKLRASSKIKQRVQASLASALVTFVVGLAAVGGGYLFGPGQVIMFGNMLQDFNFGPVGNSNDDLSNVIYRRLFIKQGNLRNLGVGGRKIQRKVETSFGKAGIQVEFDSRTGDIESITDADGKKTELGRGKTYVDADGRTRKVTNSYRRAQVRAARKASGLKGFANVVLYRPVVNKSFGIGFAPFGNARSSVRRITSEKMPQKLRRIVTGTGDRFQTTPLPIDDAEEGRSNAEETRDSSRASGDPPNTTRSKVVNGIKSQAKGAAMAYIATLGCTAKNIADSAEEAAYLRRAAPAVKTANTYLSGKDTIMAGAMPLEDIVGLADQLNGNNSNFSGTIGAQATGADSSPEDSFWFNDAAPRRAAGLDWKGRKDLPDNLDPTPTSLGQTADRIYDIYDNLTGGFVFNSFDVFGDFTPYGFFCDAMKNRAVQAGLLAVGFLTPFRTAVDLVIAQLANEFLIEPLINQSLGEEISGDETGSGDLAAIVDMGLNYSASVYGSSLGGTTVSDETMAKARADFLQERRTEFAKQGLLTRIFDYTHPDSFITAATLRAPKNKQQFATTLTNAPSHFFNKIASIVHPPAFANDCEIENCLEDFDNYGGIPQKLIAPSIIAKVESGEIDVIEVADWVEEKPQSYLDAEEEFRDCFESTSPDSFDLFTDVRDCSDLVGDETFDKYVVSKTISIELDSLSCLGEDEDCPISAGSGGDTSPNSNANIGDPSAPSTADCAENTIDLGTDEEVFSGGNVVEMRLCGIPNIPSTSAESTPGHEYYVEGADGIAIVNTNVSGAWYSLAEKAINDGIDIRATSTFRTNAHQTDLFIENGRDTELAASPGNSHHQTGHAIDFSLRNVTGTTSCDSRATAPGDPLWDWLLENSESFGFRQYAKESWHWDASTAVSRCGKNDGM